MANAIWHLHSQQHRRKAVSHQLPVHPVAVASVVPKTIVNLKTKLNNNVTT